MHVRTLLREVRLPGLRSAEQIKKAADLLVEADWLRAPAKTVFGQPRSRVAYPVNPEIGGGDGTDEPLDCRYTSIHVGRPATDRQ